MGGRKLNWEKARWDSIKNSYVPTGEDIDHAEEAELQAWWEAHKDALREKPKESGSKRKRKSKPKPIDSPAFPKGTSVLVTEAWGWVIARERRRAAVWQAAMSKKQAGKQKNKKRRSKA